MDAADYKVLQSKLKRYRIRHQYENGKLEIRSAKPDLLSMLGLILFPTVFGLALLIMIFTPGSGYDGGGHWKALVFVFALFGLALVNFKRLYRKHRDNKLDKTFSHGSIKLKGKGIDLVLTNANTEAVWITMEQLSEEIHQGQLLINTLDGRVYGLLSLDDEKEHYLRNDLEWFRDFVAGYLGIAKY